MLVKLTEVIYYDDKGTYHDEPVSQTPLWVGVDALRHSNMRRSKNGKVTFIDLGGEVIHVIESPDEISVMMGSEHL